MYYLSSREHKQAVEDAMISAAALMEIAFHFLHFDHSAVGAVFAARRRAKALLSSRRDYPDEFYTSQCFLE